MGVIRGVHGGYHHAPCQPVSGDASPLGLSPLPGAPQFQGAVITGGLSIRVCITPMHCLPCLYLDFNTCFVSIEVEIGGIDLPSMSAIRFDLDLQNFDAPHMPDTFICALPSLAPTQTVIQNSPDPSPVTLQHQEMRTGRARLQPRLPYTPKQHWPAPLNLCMSAGRKAAPVPRKLEFPLSGVVPMWILKYVIPVNTGNVEPTTHCLWQIINCRW